jgi:hypothetical protein
MESSSTISYPYNFHPLAEVILSLSGGYTNTPVIYSVVKQSLGMKNEIKALGFKNPHRMIKKAWRDGLVRMAYRGYPAIFLTNVLEYKPNPVSNYFARSPWYLLVLSLMYKRIRMNYRMMNPGKMTLWYVPISCGSRLSFHLWH